MTYFFYFCGHSECCNCNGSNRSNESNGSTTVVRRNENEKFNLTIDIRKTEKMNTEKGFFS